jgi:hypothetical protein
MRRDVVDSRVAEVGLVKASQELKVAAILFTYRCSIACRHCLFACRPGLPDVVMDAARCVRYLGQLHELGRVVHIAGGEAMLYWDTLAETLERAASAGVTPQFLESNCSFAVADEVVRERFTFCKQRGLLGVMLSADPYHQAQVPPENFLRARRLAREIFGPANVWSTDAPDEQVREFARIARDEGRLAAHVRGYPPMLVGSAARELAGYLETYPLDALPPQRGWAGRQRPRHCADEFDPAQMWEIHIDPYDNIQTNCGVVLGKADRTPIAAVWPGRCAARTSSSRSSATRGLSAWPRWPVGGTVSRFPSGPVRNASCAS